MRAPSRGAWFFHSPATIRDRRCPYFGNCCIAKTGRPSIRHLQSCAWIIFGLEDTKIFVRYNTKVFPSLCRGSFGKADASGQRSRSETEAITPERVVDVSFAGICTVLGAVDFVLVSVTISFGKVEIGSRLMGRCLRKSVVPVPSIAAVGLGRRPGERRAAPRSSGPSSAHASIHPLIGGGALTRMRPLLCSCYDYAWIFCSVRGVDWAFRVVQWQVTVGGIAAAAQPRNADVPLYVPDFGNHSLGL